MSDTLKKFADNKAFTLIEIAIVVLIVGVLLVPALNLYARKLDADKREETIVSQGRAETFISGFRNMYGRYPCPAPMNAVPGDVNYGYEDCAATAPGVITVLSSNADPALVNKNILIGSLPFRQMNLQEQQSYDGYGNRFTYAVTEVLTDSNTFDANLGGISVVGLAGANLLQNPDTAQFIILTHGKDGLGAITRDGVSSGGCVSGAIQDENCDNDETFMEGEVSIGFDDTLIHATTDLISPWRYSSANLEDIVLADLSKFGIGTQDIIELSSGNASELTILENAVGDAVLYASGGAIISNEICDYLATSSADCFAASVIAGDISLGEGMDCATDPSGPFMVGIENGGPVCSSTVKFECPVGQFLTGIGPSGEMICDGAPAPACATQGVSASCGPARTLTATFDGGYRTVEAGECYMLDNFDSTTANSQPDIPSLQAYVDSLNAAARTGPVACPSRNLVRDSYVCNAGAWSLMREHELWDYMGSFPGNLNQNSRIANTTGPAYSITGGRTSNDCWCREDYRLDIYSCPSGFTGNRVRVRKHDCPQTRGQWSSTVYTNNTSFCSCAPYTDTQVQSCRSFYGVPSGSMAGDVTTTYNNTCSGNTVVIDPSPTVTNNCTCPAQPSSPVETTVNCPTGQTNSFTFGGNSYTGVAQIRRNTWSCPNGVGNPVSSAAERGTWSGPVTVHTEACVCDSSLTGTVTIACPSGYSGTGRQYLREWDCTIPGWEPQADWDLISDSCTACTWKRPSTTPSTGPTGIGSPVGTGGCACGAQDLCYEKAGAVYDNFTACRCLP